MKLFTANNRERKRMNGLNEAFARRSEHIPGDTKQTHKKLLLCWKNLSNNLLLELLRGEKTFGKEDKRMNSLNIKGAVLQVLEHFINSFVV
jgi:hypothetical protein